MKTLAEIAIEAGLVTKAGASKAGRRAEETKQPLVAVLVRELGVDEVALIGALRKQTRVPLIDPADIQLDSEALRVVARDVCARLRVLPLQLSTDGKAKVLRVAIADPTDTAAILELEQLSQCEIELNALPLSAIEELVEQGYRGQSTAVTARPRAGETKLSPVRKVKHHVEGAGESEISVTAQIPMSALAPIALAEQVSQLTAQVAALGALLVGKGVVTAAELATALTPPAAAEPSGPKSES